MKETIVQRLCAMGVFKTRDEAEKNDKSSKTMYLLIRGERQRLGKQVE